MKKVLTVSVCLLMLLAMALTGCNTASQSAAPATSASAQSAAPATSPLATSTTAQSAAATATPATTPVPNQDFIANRTITIMHYQPGVPEYADYKNTYAYKKIQEMTGISYDFQNSKSDNELQDLTLGLASGDLADIISCYCEGTNSSGQAAILNVMAKAGRDGMFADMKPYLANTVKYKCFLDPKSLSKDAAQNIVMRSDFNGHIYFVQTGMPRPGVPSAVWIGGNGLYIRNDIVKALGIDPASIQTDQDLYDLAVKIKAGSYVDGNGKACPAPIGPPIWGGATSSNYYPELDFGNSSGFEKDTNGQVQNVILTDYPYQTVTYIRKMLAEGLMDKQSFTMPGPQATEAFSNATYPITIMHAFSQAWDGGSDVLQSKHPDLMYVPLGPMKNHLGSTEKIVIGRGNTLQAISAQAQNPDEIVRFMDWMSSRYGALRLDYGVEGINYTLTDESSKEYLKYTTPDPWDDGKVPMLTPDWAAKVKDNPDLAKTLSAGFVGGMFTADLYKDLAATLGPADPNDPLRKWYDQCRGLLKLAAPKVTEADEIPVSGALENYQNIKILKPVLDAYNDTLIKAFLAGSDAEAKSILDGYKKQLQDAGIADACKYLQDLDAKNPGTILFYLTN